MKKVVLLVSLAAFPFLSCGVLGFSSITFVNACASSATVNYSYKETSYNENGEYTVDPGASTLSVPANSSVMEKVSISSGTSVSVVASVGDKKASYDFCMPTGGDYTVTISPADLK